MNWLLHRPSTSKTNDARRETRLSDADRKARELQLRSERVASALAARQRRNHWSETAAEIARAAGHRS